MRKLEVEIRGTYEIPAVSDEDYLEMEMSYLTRDLASILPNASISVIIRDPEKGKVLHG